MDLQTFFYFCYAWIGFAVLAFIGLQFTKAAYGKFIDKTWGPSIPNKLGWVLMEAFVLMVLYYFVFTATKKLSSVDWVIIGLFSVHYINRSFIYPFRTKTKGKKIPISIVGLALFHNLVNGFLIGYFVSNLSNYSNEWLYSWQFISGLLIFIFGMILNLKSDNTLINLRSKASDGYKIPYGGGFKYISSPNLVGEMIEWIGFAILSWSLPTFCFAFFTFCNLLPRAVANHKWYKKTFAEYPKDRKAVIPKIF